MDFAVIANKKVVLRNAYYHLIVRNKLIKLIMSAIVLVFGVGIMPGYASIINGCESITRNSGDVNNIREGALFYAKDGYVRLTELPGTVNVEENGDFQVMGTVIGHAIVSAGVANQIDSETIIYRCTRDAISRAQFIYAMNGSALRGGGYYLDDSNNALVKPTLTGGQTNIFQSIVVNVGLRLKLVGGNYFTGRWQTYPVNYEDDPTNTNNVLIRAKHIPEVEIELLQIGGTMFPSGDSRCAAEGPTNSRFINCNIITKPNPGEIAGSAANAREAAGFITLLVEPAGGNSGIPGRLVNGSLTNTILGYADFFASAYGVNNMLRISRTNSCRIMNATPFVLFPTISVQELEEGGNRVEEVYVDVKCNNGVNHGLGEFQTAMGVRVPYTAYQQALKLGLGDTKQKTVSHLLSTRYGDNDIAKGVGIRFVHSTLRDEPVWLIGNDGLTPPPFRPQSGGVTAEMSTYNRLENGWILITDNAIKDKEGGYDMYRHKFTTILEKLPNIKVESGKVEAIAYVIVQVL